MGILMDIFKPVSTWSVEEVRRFLEDQAPDDYHLIDVRQPGEYEKGHLPGARLIPMERLAEKSAELDRDKTVITYCTVGVRSRAAAQVLENAGFRDVHNMKGGIRAWRGERAEGLPEADLATFFAAATPEEHVAMAWQLEEGTQTFYNHLAQETGEAEVADLFLELTAAEEKHKATLLAVFEGLSGRPAPADFPKGILAVDAVRKYMEGGVEVAKAIAWARDRTPRKILEMGIAVETNAYDRYLILRRELADENSRRAFEILSDEERRHLEKMSRLLDRLVRNEET